MDGAEKMVTTGVLLPEALRQRAEQQAATERRSLSGFLRCLIEDHLGADDERRRDAAMERQIT